MKDFVLKIQSALQNGEKFTTKTHVEKIAATYGITNKNQVKELTELAIVNTARAIVKKKLLISETYRQIVDLYNLQVNLSQRTSESMRLQQYSTPAPISYLAGIYIQNGQTSVNQVYFEPSAGNGLLTIALPESRVYVNEIDDVRRNNLKTQGFAKVTEINAIKDLSKVLNYDRLFDGIVTNPPFGTLESTINFDGYPIKTLDHLMCIRALDCMHNNGRAAMIIGGHTTWDDKGRIQAGKNRIFFNYLHSHYNVEDVLQINGKRLYSRQGTSFDTRLILINGRKEKIAGFAPLYNPVTDIEIESFEMLFNRVISLIDNNKEKRIRIAKAKAMAKMKILNLIQL